MKQSDFSFDKAKKFVKDTSPVEEFDPNQYTEVDRDFNENLTDEEKQNAVTVPLKIISFPWNPKFEGTVFMMGKVDIQENDDQTAQLTYNYTVLKNPNNLELAVGVDEISENTEDNELLDVFIGRMVESLLYKMSNDKDFLEQMKQKEGVDTENE